MFSRDLSRTQELRSNEREGSRRFRLARRDNGNQLQSAPKPRPSAMFERVRKSSPEQIFAAMLDSARAQVHDIQEQMAATHARALEEAKAAAREVAA